MPPYYVNAEYNPEQNSISMILYLIIISHNDK